MRNGLPGCWEVKKDFHLDVSYCKTEYIKTYLLPPPVRPRNPLCRHFDAVSERWSDRAIRTLSCTVSVEFAHKADLQGSLKALSMVFERHHLTTWTHTSGETMCHAPASGSGLDDFAPHTYTKAHGNVRYIRKIEDLCAVGK